jgi:hypothetical protein
MCIVVETDNEEAVWEEAFIHYEQQGRGNMEANAYMPDGKALDFPHAVLEASLAWMAGTDLTLVRTEVKDLVPEDQTNGELTIVEAATYALAQGHHLSKSFLARAAAKKRVKARKVSPPSTGFTYWLIEKADLDRYLASERRPGRKKGIR